MFCDLQGICSLKGCGVAESGLSSPLSDTWEDCTNLERWSVHLGWATPEVTFWSGMQFGEQILADLCKAFGVKKSCTTPYHPMRDSLIESMSHSLLTLIWTHVERDSQWEEHLQLLLFMYRTTKHTTTGLSPYEILFGSNPPSLWLPNLQDSVVIDQSDYVENLRRNSCS